MTDLAKLRADAAEALALAEKATPGEWSDSIGHWGKGGVDVLIDPATAPKGCGTKNGRPFKYITSRDEMEPADAAFIARARTLLPALARAVEVMAPVVEAAQRVALTRTNYDRTGEFAEAKAWAEAHDGLIATLATMAAALAEGEKTDD